MKFPKINHYFYLILIALFWFGILEILTRIFSFSNETKQLIIFVGLLISINFSLMFSIIRNYRKERI